MTVLVLTQRGLLFKLWTIFHLARLKCHVNLLSIESARQNEAVIDRLRIFCIIYALHNFIFCIYIFFFWICLFVIEIPRSRRRCHFVASGRVMIWYSMESVWIFQFHLVLIRDTGVNGWLFPSNLGSSARKVPVFDFGYGNF